MFLFRRVYTRRTLAAPGCANTTTIAATKVTFASGVRGGGDSLDYLDDKRLYSFPKGILLLPVDLPPVDIHEKSLSLFECFPSYKAH